MSKIFSVMTYNVHSTIGMDGKASPLRISEVIARYHPTIVALQELDAGLVRTAMIDQAHLIAASLEMSYHFQATIQVEEGEYGNAILSSYPVHLVKAAPLPTRLLDKKLERRGAVWAEIDMEGRRIQVMATHFGLNWRERISQAEEITGPEWLAHPECLGPAILCGDFNSLPWSPPYRRITRELADAQRSLKGHSPRSTWPVRWPCMRIDHIFISPGLKVHAIAVPLTLLTRVASDHLPVIATLELA